MGHYFLDTQYKIFFLRSRYRALDPNLALYRIRGPVDQTAGFRINTNNDGLKAKVTGHFFCPIHRNLYNGHVVFYPLGEVLRHQRGHFFLQTTTGVKQEVFVVVCQMLCWSSSASSLVITVCPGSSDPFYEVTYYIKLVTTSWTYNIVQLL